MPLYICNYRAKHQQLADATSGNGLSNCCRNR